MAGRRRAVYGGGGGGGGGDALNPTPKFNDPTHDQTIDSVLASASSIPLLGSRAMLSFGGVSGVNRSGNSFYRSFDQEDSVDDYLDEYLNQPEKKRRLSVDQIQFLERNFEVENKLEPERKIQMAKELGLQPRQIAVWFQNRRARWKSRQLETDYETLHTNYKSLKADYDSLLAENEKLKAEVLRIKHNSLAGNAEVETLQIRNTKELSQLLKDSITEAISEEGESKGESKAIKNEEQSSGKSNISNAEFSTNGLHRTIESPCALEFEDSDLSQNGEDAELLQPVYDFPRIEDTHCHTPASSFYYGFPADDTPVFNFWFC